MLRGFAILVVVYLVVVYAIPKPAAVKPEGWRLTGIFAATIVGSIIEPIPAGALVLLAVTLSGAHGRPDDHRGAVRLLELVGLAGAGGVLHLARAHPDRSRAPHRAVLCPRDSDRPRWAWRIRWRRPTWCWPE